MPTHTFTHPSSAFQNPKTQQTQDLAARGVSLVYSRGGSGLQQQLLGQLLGLLSGTGAAPAAGGPGAAAAGAAGVQLAPDSKLFEEGQLGNTPGVRWGCVLCLVFHLKARMHVDRTQFRFSAHSHTFTSQHAPRTPWPTGGGGLTTYRELCSLANEMGQPDLIYRCVYICRGTVGF